MNLIDWLTGNPYLNLVSLFWGIVGALASACSIYLYFRYKKSKSIAYLIRSFSIIDDYASTIEGLTVKFGEQQIQRLTISKVSLWNKGNETIDARDIVTSDRLRLTPVGDGKIISVNIISEKRSANSISVSVKNNEVLIEFEFLDYNDGAIFEIYHTGLASQSLKLTGTIKGISQFKSGEYQKDYLLGKIIILPLLRLFNKLNLEENYFVKNFLCLILIPLILLPAFPFLIAINSIDIVGSLLHKIPKDYDLSKDYGPPHTED